MSDKSKLPEIVITTDGAIGTILIDGVDMSDKITEYEIKHKGGNHPELTLHLCAGNMTVDGVMVPALPDIFKPYFKPNFSKEEINE